MALQTWVERLGGASGNDRRKHPQERAGVLPVSVQLERWAAHLPEHDRSRAWSIDEIVRVTSARWFGVHAPARSVAVELRRLGWEKRRVWDRATGGRFMRWYAPGYAGQG